MAITPATSYGTQMTKLVGAAGGNLQNLPEVSLVGGRVRCFNESITFAAQASGAIIAVARLPLPCVLQFITVLASVSLGTATFALGNAGDGNSAIYRAAAVFTAVDTLTFVALTAKYQQLLSSGYDSQGLATTPAIPNQGGGAYEDIILTTAAAALPAAGTLRLGFYYTVD